VTDPDWPRGRGAAQERTTLAWVRTALSLVALAALVARQSGSVPVAVLVLGFAVLAAGWLIVHIEHRHPAHPAAPVPVLGVTALSITLALVALALVVT
jgi:uncharacterized membrane protein YidH (DUF202 family)